ncbi:MAG TPA: hypothetical protein VL947_03120, partial [Cytophagales bacterium]|nr:hypothetical protein [Cytophagales bacterium]
KDVNDTREESDAVLDESNQVILDNKATLGGRSEGAGVNNVGATSITITGDSMITILYTNTVSLDGKRRKNGEVIIKRVGDKKFHEAGGKYTVEFKNLKITRIFDLKSILINGSHEVVNVSGGYPIVALLLDSAAAVRHEIKGAVHVAFDNGTTKTWTVARARTFDLFKVTLSQVDGTTPIETGINRRGNSFKTTVPLPVVIEINNSCAGYNKIYKGKVISGMVRHEVDLPALPAVITAEFGYEKLDTKTSNFCNVKGYHLNWERGTFKAGPYFVPVYPN